MGQKWKKPQDIGWRLNRRCGHLWVPPTAADVEKTGSS